MAVLRLFRFLDYVLTLPAELSQRFDSELETLEKDLNMPYITSIERNALARGIEQGREQGREQGIEKGQHEGILKGVKYLLRQTLEVRFGASPESLLLKIEQCQDVAALRTASAGADRLLSGRATILSSSRGTPAAHPRLVTACAASRRP